MEKTYQEAFKSLNKAQRLAVETIDGPVLVIAGPGTGKTQLLSVRVAHILKNTDSLPQNILCLTFTENGADNMRKRLTSLIGQSAYDVLISTYHAFGDDLIRRFPEVFTETRLQNPVDELTKHQVLSDIIESLSYTNPIKQLRHHIGDLISTISEVKRALLTPEDLLAIAKENAEFITSANDKVGKVFGSIERLPGSANKALPIFEELFVKLQPLAATKPTNSQFGSLSSIAISELSVAIEQAQEIKKSTPLTAWKNKWLAKNSDNEFVLSGKLENSRIEALADVLEKYEKALSIHGWYDFDDMILRAIEALENNLDLRYTLQEQYLYILLDEFQDTNKAQLRLVELLTDNPVAEGRPNILAVGDDDQAIYAFQGAHYSNMLDFYNMYREVSVINLTENYRSTKDILFTARNVSIQIVSRLEKKFDGMSKELTVASNRPVITSEMERQEFLSDVAQYDWISNRIKELVGQGIKPSEIAVLARKHKQLEPLVPYLTKLGLPVSYEKREDILEAAVVRQLITMSKLVIALQSQDQAAANYLWPEVLSFEFWQIPVSDLWQLSWQVSDATKEERLTWSKALLASNKECFHLPILLFLALAGKVDTETCEQMLDYLIGTDPINVSANDLALDEPIQLIDDTASLPPNAIRSPLRSFYTNDKVQHAHPELFYETISHLVVLRTKLREHEATHDGSLQLQDLIAFIGMYEAAGERMQNTSPYNQQADAIKLMTVFKAKGLEFEHVFLPSCQDDIWGSSSHDNNNKLTLPANLTPIRHAGASDDERLRILFVALTRAKSGLHLTSYARTYSGKNTKRLKYFNEQEQQDGTVKTLVLPARYQNVITNDHNAPTLASLELNWRQRHSEARTTSLSSLLLNRLEHYQLSPTHLVEFIDLEYGGPEAFFFDILLRFPQAPTSSSQFGSAIHETLEWVQHQTIAKSEIPSIDKIIRHFIANIEKCKLTKTQKALEVERGENALRAYINARSDMFGPADEAEHNFRNEGVFIDDVHMAGKVDRMEVDRTNKTITVVDYKTGKSFSRWANEAKLYKYQLQLYCYKLLIEGSHTYKGYRVNTGRLEFIEPDSDNRINNLEITFKQERLDEVKNLIQAMWQHVYALNFPDTSKYDKTLAGIKRLESDLLEH